MKDNESAKFSWKARGRSFRYAWSGIKRLIHDEHNARIHVSAGILVVVAGIILNLTETEWCIISLCIATVLAAEGFNSAIEALCDKVSEEHDDLIGKAKDIAAGSVLLTVVGAVASGIIIFLPKIL